jgi:hypothetical protein
MSPHRDTDGRVAQGHKGATMNPHLTMAVVTARNAELQREAALQRASRTPSDRSAGTRRFSRLFSTLRSSRRTRPTTVTAAKQHSSFTAS